MREIVSKMAYNTLGRGIVGVKEVFLSHRLQKVGNRRYLVGGREPVYVGQLADADRKNVEKFYGRIDDKEAVERFGARTVDEFSHWAWRSCAIAALQMVLETVNRSFGERTMDLVRQGLDAGGYEFRRDKGWVHSAIAGLAIANGLETRLHRFMSVSEVALTVVANKYILASVLSRTGGHFWLVFGVQIEKGNVVHFLVHDPYGFESEGRNWLVDRGEFNKAFTHRAISIDWPNQDAR